ncbi:MAG: GAF domain-containing protein [Flavobacteriales bacterium]|nr:GAF domain-containing protein [Flavobacteriales bacterium]
MNILCLLDDRAARLELLPEQQLVRLMWKGPVKGDAYREVLLEVVELARERGSRLLLVDARKRGVPSAEDHRWTEEELMPALHRSGIVRMAHVSAEGGAAPNARGGQGAGVPNHAGFDNLSMAMLWLLDNAKAEVGAFLERERLDTLRSYQVLDTAAKASHDDITRLAAHLSGCPIALISLVDSDRQWFLSRVGTGVEGTARNISFCTHAIQRPDRVMVVTDARDDERFRSNPLVVGEPHVRFYAGAPLVSPDGHPLGTLCVIDHQPRELSPGVGEALQALARLVVMQLEFRRLAMDLSTAQADIARFLEHLHADNRLLQRISERQRRLVLDEAPRHAATEGGASREAGRAALQAQGADDRPPLGRGHAA